MTRTLAALLLLPLLANCALFESRATRAMRNSPDYRAGYSDGCASANSSANPRADTQVRDNDAYANNPAYRSGWGTGRSACRSMDQMQNNNFGGIPPLR